MLLHALARDSENAIVRPPLWAWTSRLCWTATTKYATGRDDDHVAQECLDPPQSLVVIVSGFGVQRALQTFGWHHASPSMHVHNIKLVVAAS